MAKYQAESSYICSVYPGTLPDMKMYHGIHPDPRTSRCTVYRLKPVKRGEKPHVIEVSDGFENKLNVPESAENGTKVWMSAPVTYNEIVENLLRCWAGNMVGLPAGVTPGIMEIANSTPTQANVQALMEMQTAYAEHLFQEGERMAREHNFKEITQPMRDMAEWLGRERLWANPEMAGATVDCPACTQPIKAEASVCHHCGTRVKALPEDIAALNVGAIATPKPVVHVNR